MPDISQLKEASAIVVLFFVLIYLLVRYIPERDKMFLDAIREERRACQEMANKTAEAIRDNTRATENLIDAVEMLAGTTKSKTRLRLPPTGI